MTPFACTNAAAIAAAVGAWFLPPGLRIPAWIAVGLAWHAVVAWGTFRLSSGYFVDAKCRASSDTETRIALTFDDGPDPEVTPKLLDLLAERGVHVAFFVIGDRVERHPDLVKRCADEGHLVANHSHRHRILTNFLFTSAMTAEIAACSDAIERATGERPKHYRPPFGLSNHALGEAARRNGLEIVGWDVRGFDNPGADADAVVERVLAGATPGGVVLLHDGGRKPENVVDIVTRVLDGLDERGLAVERVDRMLEA